MARIKRRKTPGALPSGEQSWSPALPAPRLLLASLSPLLRLLPSLGRTRRRQAAIELGHVQGSRLAQALHEAAAAHRTPSASAGCPWRSCTSGLPAFRGRSFPLLQLAHLPADCRREHAPLRLLLGLDLLRITKERWVF